MKKKTTLYVATLTIVAISAIVVFYANQETKKEEPVYTYLAPRKSSLAYPAEWAMMKNNAEVLIKRVKSNPGDIKALVALASLYIQEARVTGYLDYYNRAALKCVNAVLAKDASNFEALTFKSTILLSQHRFEEGLVVARQVQQAYPLNAYVYGLLIDANVELGNYSEALEAAEKMISIRPDIRSYSRIAYLREIHGDLPGAIEAMQLAIDAGARGDENTEWCRVQLGKLYEKTGKLDFAKMHYNIAEENRENYPYALGGLADIAASEKKYDEAIALYRKADSLIPDHRFKEGLAELFELTGEKEKAVQMAASILDYMKQFSSVNNKKKEEGQNEDHELAHAYMGVGDYNKALEFALAEYHRRPANIEVNETVAIVYYHQGEYAKALPYINTALKTNCRNPELLCHAGLIFSRNNMRDEARAFLQKALANNPSLPADLEKESRETLKTLSAIKTQ